MKDKIISEGMLEAIKSGAMKPEEFVSDLDILSCVLKRIRNTFGETQTKFYELRMNVSLATGQAWERGLERNGRAPRGLYREKVVQFITENRRKV